MQFRPSHLCCLLSFLLVACQPAISQEKNPPAAGASSNYKLGDRLPPSKAPDAADSYKETMWEALLPKNWDPAAAFKDLNLRKLNDADPRAMDAMQRMREAWDNAPVEPSLKGAKIRIPGFIVPLETQGGLIREFLLVPYFGACLHSPPPPSNQTIHVFPAKPVKEQMMGAVWVSGTLDTTTSKTVFGNSGYKMKADDVKPYVKKPSR